MKNIQSFEDFINESYHLNEVSNDKNAYKNFIIPAKLLIPFVKISVAMDQIDDCIEEREHCKNIFDLHDNDEKLQDKKIKDKQAELRLARPKLKSIFEKEEKKLFSKYPNVKKVRKLIQHQNLGFKLEDVSIQKGMRGNGITIINWNGRADLKKNDIEKFELTRDQLVGIITSFTEIDEEWRDDYSIMESFLKII